MPFLLCVTDVWCKEYFRFFVGRFSTHFLGFYSTFWGHFTLQNVKSFIVYGFMIYYFVLHKQLSTLLIIISVIVFMAIWKSFSVILRFMMTRNLMKLVLLWWKKLLGENTRLLKPPSLTMIRSRSGYLPLFTCVRNTDAKSLKKVSSSIVFCFNVLLMWFLCFCETKLLLFWFLVWQFCHERGVWLWLKGK